eukprot:3153970-Rhodomonas_salina.1
MPMVRETIVVLNVQEGMPIRLQEFSPSKTCRLRCRKCSATALKLHKDKTRYTCTRVPGTQ